MRVTDRLIYENATRDTARTREAAQRAQSEAATGVRVEHPSDDPAASGLIASFRMSSERLAAVSTAAAAASEELDAADGALGSIGNSLSRARELAMQFSSSGYAQPQSAAAAGEVAALAKQIVSDLNLRVGNRYLFGGNRDGAAPFDSTTTPPGAYLGDDAIRLVEIAPGVREQANVRADVAVKGANGGRDVFQVLQDLQTALLANDTTAVAATLAGLDDGISQVSAARSQAGASMHAFDTAVSATRVLADGDTERAARLGEVDLVKAAINLQATQTALQASLAATAQSFKISLLDFL